MPITKRLPMLVGHLGNGLEYIQREDKCDHGLLVTGVYCNPDFAFEEFEMNRASYNDKNKRAGYHIIQSFDYRDTVDPNDAHEIALKMVEELYPNYQCVIATHIDKGHIHNHIVLSSMNLDGRKLVDKLSHPKESLYALRDQSDLLAMEYGYTVLGYSPKIGSFDKSKTFKGLQKNWKREVTNKIDELKTTCFTFDELLEALSNEGYVIANRGKYITVKPYGKERAMRIKTLGIGYSEQDLKTYFYEKIQEKISIEEIDNNISSEYQKTFYEDALVSQKMVYYSQKGLDAKSSYPKYYTSRAFEYSKFQRLKQELAFMKHEGIESYEDIIAALENVEHEYYTEEQNFKNMQDSLLHKYERTQLAEKIVGLHHEYLVYQETLDIFPDAKPSEEIRKYLEGMEILGVDDIHEVRSYIADVNTAKRDTNKQLAKVTYLKQRLSNLNNLKATSMQLGHHYIKGMSIHKNMIIEERSTEDKLCIKLPYTKQYLYLNREEFCWNSYGVRGDIYFINEKKYELYDENDNCIDIVEGDELVRISLNEKDKVSAYYKGL